MLHEKYTTGIKILDEQHEKFFTSLKSLKTAIIENKSKKEVHKLIDSLDFYSKDHMDYEESLAQQINFTRLDDLIESHNDFKKNQESIKRIYESHNRKTSKIYALHLISTLSEWIDAHLKYVEFELIGELKKAINEGFEP